MTNQTNNPMLIWDCEALLASKDTLRGTGVLNWATSTNITTWDSITVAGTPQRVTKLRLANKNLTGTIPERLTDLDGLTEIKLSGNNLTGCIPVALEQVSTSDLGSLNLLYCQPPIPGNVIVGTGDETSIALSWDAVSNTSKYQVEYQPAASSDWTIDNDTLTGTSHIVDKLECESEYRFRVSAHGSGTVHAAEWSDPSEMSLLML